MSQTRHPGGLYLLFTTEMAERFSYYGMRTILVLYLVSAFFGQKEASQWYGSYTGLVYLTPLLGGYLADKLLGLRRSIVLGGVIMAIGQFLMFASACTVRQSIFSAGGQMDPSVDNTLSFTFLLLGLLSIVIGNGFFKPCASTMVGGLYPQGDSRVERGYTIFYSGINLGAFFAPLVCGYLARSGGWADPSAYKWGFFCAGVAMIVALICFIAGKNRLLVGPDGEPLGTAPAPKVASASGAVRKGGSPVRAVAFILAGAALLALFSRGAENVNDYISAAVFSASIVLPVMIITDRGLTRGEKMRIGVIYIIAVFAVVFWGAYEQAGSSLTLIGDRQCDRHIGSWEMPTAWLQSINPIVVVLFTPVMNAIWGWLSRRGKEPSAPTKQAWGLVLLSVGFVIIAWGSRHLGEGQLLSMWWIWGLYFVHSIAELCLSPIGLSMVNKLSPARFASLMMGVWFMSSAVSNVLAGELATLLPVPGEAPSALLGFEIATLSDFFTVFAVMGGVAGVILFTLCRILNRMAEAEERSTKPSPVTL